MSKAEHSEQIDADILQCKADILRARDIMPPFAKQNEKQSEKDISVVQQKKETEPAVYKQPEPKAEAATSKEETAKIPEFEKEPSIQNDIPKLQVESVDISLPDESAKQKKAEIPTFDLAENIMAEHRKVTAVKRKAPGKKTESQGRESRDKSVGYNIKLLALSPPEQKQIISDIVARDIERLCRG